MPETHHIYGPSTLKNRELCPGWQRDKESDKTYADEGTLMHLAAETGDLSILVTEEQRNSVEMVLKYVEPLAQRASEDYKELRLEILGGKTFGTADRVIVIERDDTEVHVIDYKFGRSAIDDAEHNRQGMAYALGAFSKFKTNRVTVHFLIPRRDEITRHTFTVEDIADMATTISTIIDDALLFAKTRNPCMLRPSHDACIYCGDLGCEKRNNLAVELAKKYEPLEVVEEIHSSQITEPSQMAKALMVARVMEKWASSVKTHATRMVLEGGMDIPGFEIRERAGTVKISDNAAAYNVLKELGYTDAEVIGVSEIDKTALELLVKSKAPPRQKAKKLAELNAKLTEANALSSGEPSRFLQKSRE